MLGLIIIDQLLNVILTVVKYQGIFMFIDVILMRIYVPLWEKASGREELPGYEEDKWIIWLDTSQSSGKNFFTIRFGEGIESFIWLNQGQKYLSNLVKSINMVFCKGKQLCLTLLIFFAIVCTLTFSYLQNIIWSSLATLIEQNLLLYEYTN